MGTANAQLLDELLADGLIHLQRDPFLESAPQTFAVDWDRVEGMMLGLAIGDSLGNTSEGRVPCTRQAEHGEIRNYLPNKYAEWRAIGVPTDDTQLAFWTLEQLIADGGLNMDHLAERLTRQQIFGIGASVREFSDNYRNGVRPWYACAPVSAGNGALMRIAPLLIPHLRSQGSDLWADSALAATLTHNDATSTSACVAWVSLLWQLLAMRDVPEPQWWVDAYIRTARSLEGETLLKPRSGAYTDYEGPLWRFVETHLPLAYAQGLTVLEAAESWSSAAFLLETVPCALYILMRHAADPEEALVRAVNDTKDNDTIAAIVGCAIGALHGRRGFPTRWLDGMTGRTAASDDGRIFTLLAEARGAFGPPSKPSM